MPEMFSLKIKQRIYITPVTVHSGSKIWIYRYATIKTTRLLIKKNATKHSTLALFPLMLLIMCINTSCNKEAYLMDKGVITGFDSTTCPCCGGLVINFKGVLQSYSGDFYLIENNPAEFGIDAFTTFPVRVKADWKQDLPCVLPVQLAISPGSSGLKKYNSRINEGTQS